MLRMRMLGEFAVERDGVPIVLGSSRRVLAFLALNPGMRDRDAVAATLWPDTAQSGARANLRTAIWSLRKSVGEDAIVSTRLAVGLRATAWWVDVREVGSVADRGELAAAIELGRGELLADLSDGWAAQARAEHGERYLTLLDRRADQAEADGDAAEAARVTRVRCALTPVDEPAHRVLLHRLLAAGDRSGAVVVAREFVQRLRADVGVAPSAATRAVLADVRGPISEAGNGDLRRTQLFGRSAQLAELTTAWNAARDGHGRLVVVTGAGGIGKTRLISELARLVGSTGARVALGAGVDVGGEAPLAVWHELAHELVRSLPTPPESAQWPAELGRLAPALAVALGHPRPPSPIAAPELERLRIFDAVLRLVEWAAASRPLLLVAEDVHRADRPSLQLCAHIGRRLGALPVLFVVTRRDRPARADVDALITDLAGRGIRISEVELGPLTDVELAAVARSVAPLASADVDRVVAAAEGSPLLAVESARALASGSTAPPSSLRAAVRATLGGLPASARELAEGLAVAGRELTAAEVAALDVPDRVAAVRHLLDTGLVRRVGHGLRFHHALLAEAARADLRDPEARYEQVALAIEAAAPPAESDARAAEVARHLSRAGRNDLAGPRWRQAGQHARSLGALPEALAFWREAVRCEPHDALAHLGLAELHGWLGQRADFEHEWETAIELTPDAERSAAWCWRGNVLRSVVCHPSAALAAYRRALELIADDAPPAIRAEVLVGVAGMHASAGDPDQCGPLLDQVARLVPNPDPDMVADIEWATITRLMRSGQFEKLEPAAERAAITFTEVNRPELAFAGLVMLACGLAAGGDLEAALRTADAALTLTRGVPTPTLDCLAARAHILSRLGRHDEALPVAGEQLAMAERLDSPSLVARAQNDAGLVALRAGRLDDAATLLGSALDGDAAISRPATRLARAEALAGAGRPDEASAELRRAALEPVGPGDQSWALVPQMSRVQGLIALARGDKGEARRRLAEAVAGWERQRRPAAGDELMANLVDLARPPVVGLVEPAWELARVSAELADITQISEVT